MSHPNRAPKLLLLSVALTLILYAVPFGRQLAYPLVLLSTVAHELGHGLGALLSGGSFERLSIYSNGSGVALTSSTGLLSRVITLTGGLIGPSCLASLGFRLSVTGQGARRGLTWGGLLILICCVCFARNAFGFLFLGALGLGLITLGQRASLTLCQLTLTFLSTQLALSVYSRADYLFTPIAELGGGRRMPSDVGQLEELLLLPYWLWGALIGGLSLLILWLGVRRSLRALH